MQHIKEILKERYKHYKKMRTAYKQRYNLTE